MVISLIFLRKMILPTKPKITSFVQKPQGVLGVKFNLSQVVSVPKPSRGYGIPKNFIKVSISIPNYIYQSIHFHTKLYTYQNVFAKVSISIPKCFTKVSISIPISEIKPILKILQNFECIIIINSLIWLESVFQVSARIRLWFLETKDKRVLKNVAIVSQL
jgi:hypothetical protein